MKTDEEITVSSWIELRDVIEELASAGWAFRGQSDAGWPLESFLTRHLKDFGGPPKDWMDRERMILHTFKRKAHLLLSRTPEADETLEWLALMQHHGAPTRLLDFTWSPYVAAFFALEKAKTNAAIWTICYGPKVRYYRGSKLSALLNRVLKLKEYGVETRDKGLRAFAKAEKLPDVLMGNPVLMNQRMTTQAGVFIIPTRRIEVPLDVQPSLFKITLKTQCLRKQTMDTLYSMNINNATLFPGVDGLARSLAFELERETEWTPDRGALRRLIKRRNELTSPDGVPSVK